ncbi:MAG TPA: Hsp20/alpha crystallin family protein [Sphingomonas sp.]
MTIRDLIPWSRQNDVTRLPVEAPRDREASLFALHREMNRVFDSLFDDWTRPLLGSGPGRGLNWPQIALAETERDIRVTAELPGLDETDVEITVEEGILTLRGEKQVDTEDQARGYSERSYGRFERRIGLPRGVERDQAEATFRNGLLTVTLPKTAAANENVRRIPVNSQAA